MAGVAGLIRCGCGLSRLAGSTIRPRMMMPTIMRNYCSQAQAQEASTSSEDLIITDRCVERLKGIAKEGESLRVMVDGGGCSGFEYKFSLDKTVNYDDRVFEKSGAKILVDALSLDYMKGATLDYQEELIRSSFRIVKNPLAEKGCSCGASFALRMD